MRTAACLTGVVCAATALAVNTTPALTAQRSDNPSSDRGPALSAPGPDADLAASLGPGPTTTTSAATGTARRRPPGTTTTSTTTTSTTTTTTTTAPPSANGDNCGGQPTLVADGMTWDCTFDSEFSGTSLDTTKWMAVTTAATGYTSGLTACFVNSPDNISVGNGYLSITARKEAEPFICYDPYGDFITQYTSATLATYGMFSQAYGRFEIKAKVPSTSIAGLQSSFWLYPQDETEYGPWPASGEIDIAETYSEYPDIAIPYIHYDYDSSTTDTATDTNVVTAYDCSIDPDQFNDYVVDWTPTTITMIYNGQTCLVDHWIPSSPQTAPEPFNEPFFVNLTQALGIGTNQFNPSTTPLPATTEVQYVRVWQEAP